MRLIAGHGRLMAMQQLRWKECDIVELDLPGIESAALAIALNRSAELAEWDNKALSELLKELEAEDAMDGLGFEQTDIDQLLADLEAEAGLAEVLEDEVPLPPDAATSRAGDIWILGDHRVMCGDSSSPEDLDRLLAGAPIHLANCDAPYNVKVEPRSNNAIAAGLSSFTSTHHQKLDVARHPSKAKGTTAKMRPKDRPLQNDFVSDEAFHKLLRDWFGNASRVLLPGRAFYFWGGYANLANYPAAIAESGLYFSQAIVWNKMHPVLTRKDFMGAFELAFYGWKEGAAHQFFGPNNAYDLWEIKKLNHTAMVHLTEKPVELAVRSIQYSTRKGENVLDLFGGSGSTMAACQQTGRHAFLMEIDTLYCDVIVDRWQRLTGGVARLEATGQGFAAVRAERVPNEVSAQ
jgi:DNA modification methylase